MDDDKPDNAQLNFPLRIAVVGTGPSGIYSVEHLLVELGKNVEIDLYERLPTPWGMVRSAVAPDHLLKKQIIDTSFSRLLNHRQVRYFGNVQVGVHVLHEELAAWYNGVIYASGADGDTLMNIPGEDLQGCVGAREFVHWYNGHPDFSDRRFNFSHKRAVIVGNGNVALDVARILTLKPEELKTSDMPANAIEALRESAIEEVVILGRRGQAQAAFHRPELEEFEQLTDVEVTVEGEGLLTGEDPSFRELDWSTQKKLETLRRLVERKVANPRKRIVLYFLASPEAVVGGGRVEGVQILRNKLAPDSNGKLSAKSTGQTFTLEAGLVMRAIGFRGRPMPGLPFDSQRNVLPNCSGRLTSSAEYSDNEAVIPGVYVTGWLKRGPRGLIGTNKMCAGETVECLLEDVSSNKLLESELNADEVLNIIEQRQPQLVLRESWLMIDHFERQAGGESRPRAKLTTHEELLECALKASG
ncbi:MAG: FAD/NAD(P)-binding protein [Pseudomonadota bacterium]